MQKNKKISEKDFLESVSAYLESDSPGAIFSKVLLATIAMGGIVCVGAVAPNIIKAVAGVKRFSRPVKPASARTIISKFKRDGLVCLKTKKGVVTVQLTEKGRRQVYAFTDQLRIRKPLLWDRKWRVVVFDIPVKKNKEHVVFRKKIKELGFRQIQKSVWALPYKCEDEVLFLAKTLHIENTIEIFTVQKMIHEKELRKRFNYIHYTPGSAGVTP